MWTGSEEGIMTKTNVTNKHDALLNIAGVDVRPGATAAVDDKALESWKTGNAASLWLEQELVVIGDKSGSKAKEPKSAEPKAPAGGEGSGEGKVDRAAYLQKAKDLDLGLPANVSNAKLVEAVNAAEAEKAKASGNEGDGSGE